MATFNYILFFPNDINFNESSASLKKQQNKI